MAKLQALVLADHIYQDVRTGKKVIAGTFNQIGARNFGNDVFFSRITFAYICLTEIRGKVELTLRYVDLRDERPLFMTKFAVESNNPLASNEIMMEVPPFPLPHPGVYAFEILDGDDPLGSLRIMVSEIKIEDTEE